MRRRDRLLKLGLLVLGAAIPLAAVEGVLRITSPTGGRFLTWPPHLEVTFHPAADVMPGVHGVSRFRINADGIRGDDFSAGQRHRILAIGGSTTESLYLDDSEAWPRLLQQILNERLGEPAVWVGNVGKSALNTRHHVFQVRELLPQYSDIDAVILLIGVNDLGRRLARDGDFLPISREPPEEIGKLFRSAFSVLPEDESDHPFLAPVRIISRLRELRDRLLGPPDSEGVVQDDAGRVYTTWRSHRRRAASIRRELPNLDAALEEYRHNVGAIIGFARRAGARVILATQPTLWRADLPEELRALLWMGGVGRFQREPGQDYYSVEALASGMEVYNRTLLAACREHRADCVDLASLLPRDTSVFYDDCHFNESGARKVAAIFADYLLRSSAFH